VQNVNLSGMGCSAGLVSVGLAKNILQVSQPGTHVLVVSTEILSSQNYVGKEREMLLPNCIFRIGAGAMILSNCPDHARFKLGRVVRTTTAARDSSYRCVFQEEDGEGHLGVRLSKDLLVTAGQALKTNIAAFATHVLPASEKLLVAVSLLKRALLSGRTRVRLYRPDFRTAFEHFCIHAGGAHRDRRDRALPRALRRGRGGVPDDAAPVRQHVQQLDAVRAGVHRGQGPDEEGRPGMDGRLRLRVQVQQRRLGVRQAGRRRR
jgi:3-ketoacyl-CoA synthase